MSSGYGGACGVMGIGALERPTLQVCGDRPGGSNSVVLPDEVKGDMRCGLEYGHGSRWSTEGASPRG